MLERVSSSERGRRSNKPFFMCELLWRTCARLWDHRSKWPTSRTIMKRLNRTHQNSWPLKFESLNRPQFLVSGLLSGQKYRTCKKLSKLHLQISNCWPIWLAVLDTFCLETMVDFSGPLLNRAHHNSITMLWFAGEQTPSNGIYWGKSFNKPLLGEFQWKERLRGH